MSRIHRVVVACFAVLAGVVANPAFADELPQPAGEVILTVSGKIANTNGHGTASFDLAMLEAIEAAEIRTDTIWTTGEQVFTGVRLDKLLAFVGAEGAELAAVAINDYSVRIPVTDATPDGALLAYALNGSPMSRREKGPLWVVYPYSSSSNYRSEVIYSRSIWQLDRIDVTD